MAGTGRKEELNNQSRLHLALDVGTRRARAKPAAALLAAAPARAAAHTRRLTRRHLLLHCTRAHFCLLFASLAPLCAFACYSHALSLSRTAAHTSALCRTTRSLHALSRARTRIIYPPRADRRAHSRRALAHLMFAAIPPHTRTATRLHTAHACASPRAPLYASWHHHIVHCARLVRRRYQGGVPATALRGTCVILRRTVRCSFCTLSCEL